MKKFTKRALATTTVTFLGGIALSLFYNSPTSDAQASVAKVQPQPSTRLEAIETLVEPSSSVVQEIVAQPTESPLGQRVYDYFVDISTTKLGETFPLFFWGASPRNIPGFRGHIDNVVSITEQACQQHTFPTDVSCPSLMLSVMIQESQLKPDLEDNGTYGIAQMSPDTASEYIVLQGPKYKAWQTAKSTRVAYERSHPLKKRTTAQTKYIVHLKHDENFLKGVYTSAAQRILIQRLEDPAQAIPAAIAYMDHLFERFGTTDTRGTTDISTPVAHYNAGENATPLPSESRSYAAKVIRINASLSSSVSASNR
ncbi:MAG: hypothetical protein WC254_02285 [Candidatus Woesearchaeota archaeon]|jgi:hypothetical protein